MMRRGLGVYEKRLVSLRETLGFITRNAWFHYEKRGGRQGEKKFEKYRNFLPKYLVVSNIFCTFAMHSRMHRNCINKSGKRRAGVDRCNKQQKSNTMKKL